MICLSNHNEDDCARPSFSSSSYDKYDATTSTFERIKTATMTSEFHLDAHPGYNDSVPPSHPSKSGKEMTTTSSIDDRYRSVCHDGGLSSHCAKTMQAI
jgi:hypothetical protein